MNFISAVGMGERNQSYSENAVYCTTVHKSANMQLFRISSFFHKASMTETNPFCLRKSFTPFCTSIMSIYPFPAIGTFISHE
jgi:hypothetical protein